ncbi:TetR/AcrR family transcriptional regulator [Georgenia sp. Z1491]|uniref:TetR/AcrR family transcriptional regulator n=1 Tax=Georgenia sp. Z1491 TaxID=3416707 RepID=UPI003CEA41FD
MSSAAVLDMALTLFAERGYHGTTLRQIAEALGIRTPSLYNHMTSKASLLDAITTSTITAVVDEFTAATEGVTDPVERLRRATEVYAFRHAVHRRETMVVNGDAVHLEDPARSLVREKRRWHERAFRQIIVDGVDAGVFDVESAKLASFAIREMCVSVSRWFRVGGGDTTPEELSRQYGEYALRIAGVRRTA